MCLRICFRERVQYCVCVSICILVCESTRLCPQVCVSVKAYVYAYMYVSYRLSVCTYLSVNLGVQVCVSTSVFTLVCVCVCARVCVHVSISAYVIRLCAQERVHFCACAFSLHFLYAYLSEGLHIRVCVHAYTCACVFVAAYARASMCIHGCLLTNVYVSLPSSPASIFACLGAHICVRASVRASECACVLAYLCSRPFAFLYVFVCVSVMRVCILESLRVCTYV